MEGTSEYEIDPMVDGRWYVIIIYDSMCILLYYFLQHSSTLIRFNVLCVRFWSIHLVHAMYDCMMICIDREWIFPFWEKKQKSFPI